MARFIQAIVVSGFWLAWATPALADSFFLRYEADRAFPEEEGWTRTTQHPSTAHVRTVEDGHLCIDSMAALATTDHYSLGAADLIPNPSELLRVDWRMRVLQQEDFGAPDWFGDAAMHIGRSYSQSVSFYVAPGWISVVTPGGSGPKLVSFLEPEAWHTYAFLTDMAQYDLYMDGTLLFHSVLYTGAPDPPDPGITWGDTWSGAGSESQWDYVRVTIVPEPAGILAATVFALALSMTARKGVEHV